MRRRPESRDGEPTTLAEQQQRLNRAVGYQRTADEQALRERQHQLRERYEERVPGGPVTSDRTRRQGEVRAGALQRILEAKRSSDPATKAWGEAEYKNYIERRRSELGSKPYIGREVTQPTRIGVLGESRISGQRVPTHVGSRAAAKPAGRQRGVFDIDQQPEDWRRQLGVPLRPIPQGLAPPGYGPAHGAYEETETYQETYQRRRERELRGRVSTDPRLYPPSSERFHRTADEVERAFPMPTTPEEYYRRTRDVRDSSGPRRRTSIGPTPFVDPRSAFRLPPQPPTRQRTPSQPFGVTTTPQRPIGFTNEELQSRITTSEVERLIDEFSKRLGIPNADRLGISVASMTDQDYADIAGQYNLSLTEAYRRAGARYIRRGKQIRIGLNATQEDVFHEFGHALDYILGTRTASRVGMERVVALSEVPPMVGGTVQQVLGKHMPNLREYVRNKYDNPALVSRYSQPDELFAQIISGERNHPLLLKVREEMLNALFPGRIPLSQRPIGFKSGGLVGGTGGRDNVPAMLSPGEYVLNRRIVQGLQQGGTVQNAPATSQRVTEQISISFSAFSNSVASFGTFVNEIPKSITLDIIPFNQSIENFSGILRRFETTITGIPESIRVEAENQNVNGNIGNEQQVEPAMQTSEAFRSAVDTFGGYTNIFEQGISGFGAYVESLNSAVGRFGDMVSSFNQGFSIDANYNVQVNITGSEAFAEMGVQLEENVKQSVLDHVDSILQRLSDFGPEMKGR